jgi:hypothetical protein
MYPWRHILFSWHVLQKKGFTHSMISPLRLQSNSSLITPNAQQWHIQCQRTNLAAKDGKDGLSMDEVGGAKVVKAAALEDLGASLEPHSLTEAEAVLAKDLGGHAPESAKHGPTSMDDLSLAVSLEGLGVSRKTSSVLQAQSHELLIADFEEGPSDTQNRELRLQWEDKLQPQTLLTRDTTMQTSNQPSNVNQRTRGPVASRCSWKGAHPAVVAWELSVKVAGDIALGKGSEPLGAVRACTTYTVDKANMLRTDCFMHTLNSWMQNEATWPDSLPYDTDLLGGASGQATTREGINKQKGS